MCHCLKGDNDSTLGWFSMSPLPRLHHHDIMTIVDLPCHDKVLFSHFYTEKKKKKKGKIPFPGPSNGDMENHPYVEVAGLRGCGR